MKLKEKWKRSTLTWIKLAHLSFLLNYKRYRIIDVRQEALLVLIE